MKKIFLTLVLFFDISVSSSIHAYANEIATDESVSETISNESLSDEVIDSLTIDDFVKAYEISSSDVAFKDLSEDDQNLYMIKLYNDIYESKSYFNVFFDEKNNGYAFVPVSKNFSKIDSTLEEVKEIYDEDPQYFVAEYKQ